MPEIGLVYPNLVEHPRRYVASANTKGFQRQDVTPSPRLSPPPPIMEEALPGAASVSSFQLGGVNVVVTTSASLTNVNILCVAMSWTRDALESPILMELDLRDLNLGPLVAIQAFAGESSNRVQMILVDVQGTILTLALTEKLVPLSDFQVLKSTDYIQETTILQHVTGSELQSTMVAFLNADTLVIAFNPFILTIDLHSETGHVWSELQCLEDMRSRSSTIGNILTNVSDLLLGKEEEGLDMAPTAALCLTTSAASNSNYCFTLHADATIRKWRMDTNFSFLPQEVVTLEDTAEKLPLPSNWSDARNSVCLCARLYKHVYVLAAQIRTDGAMEPMQSDCHLRVFWGTQVADSAAPCLALQVPQEATALVGMEFVPTQPRCTLSVLLEAANTTLQLTYPPSNMSIVSSEPIVENTGNLDTMAKKERTRIESLSLGSTILDDLLDSNQTTLEQALHELDSMYMKYLFRPVFPRGTGTVLPPSESCIRRALAKLVYGAAKHKEPPMSIELETLRTMHEWRQKENRKLLALATTPIRKERRSITPTNEIVMVDTGPSTLSVYDSFVHNDPEEEADDINEMNVDEQDEEFQERLEQERSVAIESHENRWRRFLLQVWEEEQLLRIPLTASWLDSIPVQVIVRAGITTVVPQSSAVTSTVTKTPFSILDAAAMKLLRRIEEDKDKEVRMNVLEQQVANLVSKAQLAVYPLSLSPLLAELTSLGRWAWSSDEDAISDAEHEELEQAASTLSASQLVSWIGNIEATGHSSFPGLELVGGSDDSRTAGRVSWSQSQVANCQLRHSACNFSTICIDSVRRLQLSRCLLLTDLVEGRHAREAALRAYLHSIAVLWTSAQPVPMPSTALQTKRVKLHLGPDSPRSPPNKRLSFGDDASSILSPASTTTTTAMDVLMIEISQTMDGSSSASSSPAGAALLMSRSYFKLAFPNRGDVPIGKASMLPELGALPKPLDDSIATDYPRLALRLLAPFVACTLPEDTADVVLARKESLAECLLIESHSDSSPTGLKTRMREMACDLLVPESSDHGSPSDQQQISTAVDFLKSAESPRVPQQSLVNTMHQIIEAGSSIEINRLCELETVKDLFALIASGATMQMDEETKSSISFLAQVMLHLSRVMHRLKILERHIGVRGAEEEIDNSEIILGFISTAISEMRMTFPDNVCHAMPEYVNMWSGLFHHSVSAGQWRQAYSACVKNPLSERRESNFRRLVRAMVDSGALSELLEMCTELGIRVSNSSAFSEDREISECVDLYEIASEILADATSSDLYTVRATSSEPSRLSDYQGALYALHASQKQWRRAAQSMDLRFLNARKALATRTSDFSFNLRSAELRDHLIVEDLVLSAVGSINAIQLVKDSAHRFLVSGEYGPYNMIPVDGFEGPTKLTSRIKRTRSPFAEESKDGFGDEGDRVSNFMSVTEMQGRAIRNVALRTLFFDKSSSQTYAKDALMRDLDSANSDVDELFKNGYYRYGLLLSKAWSNNRKALTGSHRPNGKDMFYSSLVHLIQTSLIPLSTESPGIESRPSIQQLHSALDGIGASEAASSCIVTDRCTRISSLESAVLRAGGHALIRKITLAHSTAETPVALDVASGMLEQGGEDVKLPSWLENLLLGTEVSSSSGLFAKRATPGSGVYYGNPSALLTLYTEKGMFVEACNLVTLTLTGHNTGLRESGAASRLPEKGDIDFVPYQTIDLLWNLIEVLLSKKKFSRVKEREITDSRDRMEFALEKHFGLLNISEMGLKSARALKR
jgi:hypothetical protein